ncbi:MAG: PDR/VanB family oxidoreductase [Saccharospirillum sp.]|nr:PDR/VanB family oxidoreductase [Saccharospirillum sp.]
MSTKTLKVKVTDRQMHTPDIVVLALATADGTELPAFEAGAHLDVQLGEDLSRQYSLCNDPAERNHYRLGVLKDPASRGGSVAVHNLLQPGTEVLISEPRNQFPLHGEARHSLLCGGGIGITPMIAMAYSLKRAGSSFELHYSMRSLGTAAFLDELKNQFGDQLVLHPDDDPNARFDPKRLIEQAPKDTHLYVCGPGGYMDWVMAQAKAAGLDDSALHYEYFNAEVDLSGGAFEVVAQSSGVTVQVEDGQSIADALKAAGIKVDVSCEQGVCGTCICDVIEGTPDHKDHFLTEEEKEDNDQMAICCSRALSERLVLDI